MLNHEWEENEKQVEKEEVEGEERATVANKSIL